MPKPKTRVAVLKASRELIADKKHWVKGEYVEEVTINGLPSARYCAVGAMREIDGPAEEAAMKELAKTILAEDPEMGEIRWPEDTIINYNDRLSTTHAALLDMFDRTIERLSR